MFLEWNDQVVAKFLSEYKKYECLWNPYHEKFHDCYIRFESLKKIVRALRNEITIKDCLNILRIIRKKYVKEETENLNWNNCSEKYQPKWQNIVDSLLEKIIHDEECKELTGNQRYQKNNIYNFKNKERNFCRNTKKKKSHKYFQNKLEKRNRFCNNVEKTKESCNCKISRPQTAWGKKRDNYLDNLKWTVSDCVKTIECPAYASHLDRLRRVENICKDTSSHPCQNRLDEYNKCNDRNLEGKKRNIDIQPTFTDSRSCRSSVSRNSSAGNQKSSASQEKIGSCSPRNRKHSKEKCTEEKSDKYSVCCPCPPTIEKSKECGKKIMTSTASSILTKETCPSYSIPRKNMTDQNFSIILPYKIQNIIFKTDEVTTCPEKSSTVNCKSVGSGTEPMRNMCVDPGRDQVQCTNNPDCSQNAPRVAAKFENSVLEGYSKFKLVLPDLCSKPCNNSATATQCCESPPSCSQKVQTDMASRDCGVMVNDAEFLSRGNNNDCCLKKFASKRDVQIGTERDDVECCQDNVDDLLEFEKCLHDYVLLTPGGKYIPLVKTKSDPNEKIIFNECCINRAQQQVSEVCENVSSRNQEKPIQSGSDNEKCNATTAKLLLRCLEQMLNLEEQEGKTAEAKEEICEPCIRKTQERFDKTVPCCTSYLNEKPTTSNCNSNTITRGKLTQNLLEILKCALDLDSKKDDYDNDELKQDCCKCDVINKVELQTLQNSCRNKSEKCVKNNNHLIQCDIIDDDNKFAQNTTTKDNKLVSCQNFCSIKSENEEISVIRNEVCVPEQSNDMSELRPHTASNTKEDKNILHKRTSTSSLRESTNDVYPIRYEDKIIEVKSTGKEASKSGTCVNSESQETQEKILSSSRGIQCDNKKRRSKCKETLESSQKKDTVLECLVKSTKRPETDYSRLDFATSTPSKSPKKVLATTIPISEYPESRRMTREDENSKFCFVKCDRSYILGSSTGQPYEIDINRYSKQYQRRNSPLRKMSESGY